MGGLSILWGGLENPLETMEDATYDNIKSHKKAGLHPI